MWSQRCCAAPRWPRRASGAAPSAAGAGTSSGPSGGVGLRADLPAIGVDERHDLLLVERLQLEQPPPGRHREGGVVLWPRRDDHLGGVAAGHLSEFRRQLGVIGILVGDPDATVLQVVNDQFVRHRLRVHVPLRLAPVMLAGRGRVARVAGAFRAHRDVRVPDLPHPLTRRRFNSAPHHRRGLLPQPTAPPPPPTPPPKGGRTSPPPPPPPPPPPRGGVRARGPAPPPRRSASRRC